MYGKTVSLKFSLFKNLSQSNLTHTSDSSYHGFLGGRGSRIRYKSDSLETRLRGCTCNCTEHGEWKIKSVSRDVKLCFDAW